MMRFHKRKNSAQDPKARAQPLLPDHLPKQRRERPVQAVTVWTLIMSTPFAQLTIWHAEGNIFDLICNLQSNHSRKPQSHVM
jgi:hypothetical protein